MDIPSFRTQPMLQFGRKSLHTLADFPLQENSEFGPYVFLKCCKAYPGLEIFFQTNLSCRASAPKNSLILTKNLLALLLRSENEKKLK